MTPCSVVVMHRRFRVPSSSIIKLHDCLQPRHTSARLQNLKFRLSAVQVFQPRMRSAVLIVLPSSMYEVYPESKDTRRVGGEGNSPQTIPLTAQTSLHPAHSPDLTPSRSQPRPRSQRFSYVFAFKETSGRPEVSRRQRGEKRSHCVVVCTDGGVL
jgi:hypothetical protein